MPTAISTSEISRRLGFIIHTDFIKAKLKVQPTAKPEGKKSGTFWAEEDFPKICQNLANHCEACKTVAAQDLESTDDDEY